MDITKHGGGVEFIDRLILDYIKANEEPEETAEGITNWWLELQNVTPSLDALTATLENLVAKGLIEKYIIEDDIFIYRTKKAS